MDITEADIAHIPRGNVRIPVEEFVQVWRAAEQRKVREWYGAGITITCRWMAAVTVRPENGRWHPARAPMTPGSRRAYEELIEQELLTAEKLDLQRPRPNWLAARPGFPEAVCATLRWAWRRSGPAPWPPPEQFQA